MKKRNQESLNSKLISSNSAEEGGLIPLSLAIKQIKEKPITQDFLYKVSMLFSETDRHKKRCLMHSSDQSYL